MRRSLTLLIVLLVPFAVLTGPAEAAPAKLTASDFRLEESAYNPAIAELDALLPNASVSAVLDSANRTGTACNPGATHQAAAFCWDSGDNNTTDWYPQGISSTADAYDNGLYDGRTGLFAGW